MDAITLGIISGLAFGIFDVLIMLPLKFEDKRKKTEAIVAAFIERFILGFLIPNVNLPINPILTGLLLGIFLSTPSAIISRAYAPIIGIGAIGGLIIGFITKIVT